MSHTPGPWTFKPVSGTPEQLEQYKKHGLTPVQNCNNQGERYIMHGDPEGAVYGRIALVSTRAERKERGKNATPYDAPDEERDANARLIAAAPELLEALKAIVNHGEPIYPADWQRLKTNGLEAIAKAKGEL